MAVNNLGTVPIQLSTGLTISEINFVRNLGADANYNSANVVLMNRNNGGMAGQVLRVKADGTGLEWADISGGSGGIGGTIATGQVAFGTATNTIGGDNELFWDNTNKRLGIGTTIPSEKLTVQGNILGTGNLTIQGTAIIGTLSGVLKASSGLISGGATTSDLPEGTNLYYTDARARNAISATAPITYDSTTGIIGLSTPLAISYGGTGLSALGTANQILGVNNGATGLEYKTLQGTVNQINVTHSAGVIILSTPQDIDTTSSPTFAGLTLNGNLNLGGNKLQNAIIQRNVKDVTTTSYTAVLEDAYAIVRMNSSSANTFTIPSSSSVNFPVTTTLIVMKYGTGNTTIQGATGVTIRDPNNLATITTQYDMRTIIKIGNGTGEGEWVIQ